METSRTIVQKFLVIIKKLIVEDIIRLKNHFRDYGSIYCPYLKSMKGILFGWSGRAIYEKEG
ncbi:hypothetical protein CN563_13205 [Bacillus sp. AFS026049]|nr:hypothetical protein B8W99_05310 [Peribacillus simplex]PEO46725.1 hypothetical protein CN563_13205 [Bacillus sp. AFS026049]